MIRYLNGTVLGKSALHITLEVGGIGYLVAVRNTHTFAIGASTALHTHLAVRENALDLYGFETAEELSMFEELLTIPKIGPKSAMQVMAAADIDLLRSAAAKNDPVYLTKMSGIGKKTAEKVVAALHDTFAGTTDEHENAFTESDGDFVDALIVLGYTHHDAREALKKLPADSGDTNARIKEALRIIGRS